MATVCSQCGKELPRGDARFCSNCGMVFPDHPSASPDADMAKDDAISVNNRTPGSPDVGWREQLAEQPPTRKSRSQDANATPWLGLAGNDAGNATPWLGLAGQEPHQEPQMEDFPTSIISSSSVAASQRQERQSYEEIEQTPTALIQVQQGQRPQIQQSRMPQLQGRQQKNGRSLLFAIAAIIIIIALGVGGWLILAQPFAISADTNPLQTTRNASLGLTIAYPTGWKSTQTTTSLIVADSSNTDQMEISQPATTTTDQTSYLKQQAAKLGMADAKVGSAVSFAGSSWQQTHGDFIINGAGYIGTIYVTEHNNHLYTLTQIAPKVTFQDEESVVFAPARTSLQFS